MRRVIAAQLRRRTGRALALLVGILVATAGFTVMTASAKTTQLRELGTIRANARASYDILVRPKGVQTPLERSDGVVRGDFLAGIYGGITLAQWHEIMRIHGVQVAAPVEILGYALPTIRVPIYLTRYVPRSSTALFRIQSTWVTDNGLTRIEDQADYLYVTPDPLSFGASAEATLQLPSGRTVKVCPQEGDIRFEGDLDLSCVNNGPGTAGTQYGWPELWAFPFLIAAVDPTQEAKLDGLDRAVTAGRYLRPTDTYGGGPMPVLVSNAPDFRLSEHVAVEELPAAAAAQVTGGAGAPALAGAKGRTLYTRTIDADDAYRYMLQQLLHPQQGLNNGLSAYWTGGPVRFARTGASSLAPVPVDNPLSIWSSDFYVGGGYANVPIDELDTSFQRLAEHEYTGARGSVANVLPLKAVGTFDPARVESVANLARLPLGLFQNPAVTGADAASDRLLRGAPLEPDGAIAGYLQQTPLMLTTLAGAAAMSGSMWSSSGDTAAPISSIRVRVTGVTGVDPVSRARVRLVAEQIAQRTGLQVDVTVGASEEPVTIDMPAGRYGRPPLQLAQNWVKLGVALALIRALDSKTLGLAGLSLLVCALFVLNAATAAVRARRVELGVLACLGWRRRQLFSVVLGELAMIGGVAGAAGVGVALGLAHVLGLSLPAWQAALTLPAALVLALLAGLVPALQASRASPAEAARVAVHRGRFAPRPRSVGGLALANLVRVPGRTVLGVLSLAIAVAAMALLFSVELAFHGSAVGTLLGNAVLLQVHGQDVAAVAMVLLLSSLGIGDVLLLSVRERARELATLSATGWRARSLIRLVLVEAAAIGLGGSLLGALIGLGSTSLVTGGLPAPTVLAAAAAAGVGLLVAGAACALPVRLVRRLPVAGLLSSE